MARPYILVFDHGTTGIRACLVNQQGSIAGQGYEKVEQIYPQPGWVEHAPAALWTTSLTVAEAALAEAKASWEDVEVIGLTNQRETSILWDVTTGQPIHNAIVWQCRRTSALCEDLKHRGYAPAVLDRSGLVLDPYFSATKIFWLLENVPEAKKLLLQNHLKFGTVDTWILWNLSGGTVHVTDPTNASRTMLYNIHQQEWDPALLEIFGVPAEILPDVLGSSQVVGRSDPRYTGGRAIPLAGIVGDQQAALFGQKCWTAGTAKSTYGTGAFLMMNLGSQSVTSHQGLLTTLGCDAQGNPCYALEGAIFTAGATLEWLQRGLTLFNHPSELDGLAASIPSNEGVYLVPAFAGLGAPYWDADARGAVFGLTQSAGKAHLARAALEAMAYQTREVLDAMQQEAGLQLQSLRVDGGVTRSSFLMQFLADMLAVPVTRADSAESTAMGAAYLAGLATGFWPSADAIAQLPETLESFEPKMAVAERAELYAGWLEAIGKVTSKRPKGKLTESRS